MSDLFKYASEAARRRELNAFTRTAASKLENALHQYQQGRGSRSEVQRRMREFERVVGQDLLRKFHQEGGIEQYGIAGQIGDAIDRFIGRLAKHLGPIGRIAQNFARGKPEAAQEYTQREINAAVNLLRSFGYEILSLDKDDPNYDRSMRAVQEILKETGTRDIGQIEQLFQQRPGETEPFESPMEAAGAILEGESGAFYPDWIRTPESTNVWGFRYDYSNGSLWVRYQSNAINSKAVQNYTSEGGMRAMAGDLGKTVRGKTGGPGATYEYHRVPVAIYKRLLQVKDKGGEEGPGVKSPGTGVWDMLRIRGSVFGSQYNYSLRSGYLAPGEGGRPAYYVPRRATSRGFRSRSVAVPGYGRRRYVSSSLPEDLRPSTGAPRPVNRGR